jgi:hypothetical protein
MEVKKVNVKKEVKYPTCSLANRRGSRFRLAEYGGVVVFRKIIHVCYKRVTSPVIAEPLDFPLLSASGRRGIKNNPRRSLGLKYSSYINDSLLFT